MRLNKSDSSMPATSTETREIDTRGIIHPRVGFEHFRLRRYRPGEVLAPYVDRLWCVSWDLAPREVFEQPIFAHPAVNVVIERDRAAVHWPATRLTRQQLTGAGWAVAAMFRPGGAWPFLGSAKARVDRAEPLAGRWVGGAAVVANIRQVPGPPPVAEAARVDLLRAFLADLAPTVVPAETTLITTAAELAGHDRSVCRVEDLAARVGVGTRSLQRLFAEHIGLSPKKVIRRYRLLEAAEAAEAGTEVSWARVAAELGFCDQAHLTREFTHAFGLPPARYAAG